MTKTKTYFAVEFAPIKPTTNFDRAALAAEKEADKRQSPVSLYEDGKVALIFYPAGQSPYGCPNGHRDNIYVDENHAECAVCGDTYRV
jgi:hypothetical protein